VNFLVSKDDYRLKEGEKKY